MICDKIENNTQLMNKYSPPAKKLKTSIVLIKAISEKWDSDQQVCYGWSQYSPRVTIHTIEAEHHELMFDPHVSKVAEYIQ
ncbi:hypothetical protein K7432_016674 [Basidiobolus ranarum]|uniref:Uncharacterized protein n=1 Tax=Basidiobolus ranarum TaxID=34480 RepID=A0ABR2WED0_9FUNG